MYSWLPNASAPVSGRLPLSMVVAAQFGRLRPLRCLPISKRHTVPHIYIYVNMMFGSISVGMQCTIPCIMSMMPGAHAFGNVVE